MPIRKPRWSRLTAVALSLGAAPWSAVHAEFRQTLTADPHGSVEVVVLAGSVEIDGWDRPEVEVTGSPEDLGSRVHLSHSGDKVSVNVAPAGLTGRSSGEVHLVVHVPAGSSVSTALVNADLKVQRLSGDARLRTISGDIAGSVDGNLAVNTVTGAVNLAAPAARRLEVKTISGNVQLSGASGEVEISTVSGTVEADLGQLSHARFNSISGAMTANFSLLPDARIEAESVSGPIRFGFTRAPAADFDVQTFSGSIDNCFGPKATQSQYGPGSKLTFRSGDGQASVRIATKSGAVTLCTRPARPAAAAS